MSSQKTLRTLGLIVAAFVLVWGLAARAQATDYTWEGDESSAWGTAGNWNPAGPPGILDAAKFDQSTMDAAWSFAVDLGGLDRFVTRINVANASDDPAKQFTLQNGTLKMGVYNGIAETYEIVHAADSGVGNPPDAVTTVAANLIPNEAESGGTYDSLGLDVQSGTLRMTGQVGAEGGYTVYLTDPTGGGANVKSDGVLEVTNWNADAVGQADASPNDIAGTLTVAGTVRGIGDSLGSAEVHLQGGTLDIEAGQYKAEGLIRKMWVADYDENNIWESSWPGFGYLDAIPPEGEIVDTDGINDGSDGDGGTVAWNRGGGDMDHYAVMWDGYITVDGGDYALRSMADDAHRVVIDGTTVLSHDGANSEQNTTVNLAGGTYLPFRAGFSEGGGGDYMWLRWDPDADGGFQIIDGAADTDANGGESAINFYHDEWAVAGNDVTVDGSSTVNATGPVTLGALTINDGGALATTGGGHAEGDSVTFSSTSLTTGADATPITGGLAPDIQTNGGALTVDPDGTTLNVTGGAGTASFTDVVGGPATLQVNATGGRVEFTGKVGTTGTLNLTGAGNSTAETGGTIAFLPTDPSVANDVAGAVDVKTDGTLQIAGWNGTSSLGTADVNLQGGKLELHTTGWGQASVGNDTNGNFPDGGSAAVDAASGSVDITASGGDVWGRSDGMYFVYQELPADQPFDVTAQVGVGDFVGGTNAWRKAGLMVRNSLDDNSRYAGILIAEGDSNGINTQMRVRDQDGRTWGSSEAGDRVDHDTPIHFRLTYAGDGKTFDTYWSEDGGVTWNKQDKDAWPFELDHPLQDNMYLGMWVTSHNTSEQTTTGFDSLTGFGAGLGATPPAIGNDVYATADSEIDGGQWGGGLGDLTIDNVALTTRATGTYMVTGEPAAIAFDSTTYTGAGAGTEVTLDVQSGTLWPGAVSDGTETIDVVKTGPGAAVFDNTDGSSDGDGTTYYVDEGTLALLSDELVYNVGRNAPLGGAPVHVRNSAGNIQLGSKSTVEAYIPNNMFIEADTTMTARKQFAAAVAGQKIWMDGVVDIADDTTLTLQTADDCILVWNNTSTASGTNGTGSVAVGPGVVELDAAAGLTGSFANLDAVTVNANGLLRIKHALGLGIDNTVVIDPYGQVQLNAAQTNFPGTGGGTGSFTVRGMGLFGGTDVSGVAYGTNVMLDPNAIINLDTTDPNHPTWGTYGDCDLYLAVRNLSATYNGIGCNSGGGDISGDGPMWEGVYKGVAFVNDPSVTPAGPFIGVINESESDGTHPTDGYEILLQRDLTLDFLNGAQVNAASGHEVTVVNDDLPDGVHPTQGYTTPLLTMNGQMNGADTMARVGTAPPAYGQPGTMRDDVLALEPQTDAGGAVLAPVVPTGSTLRVGAGVVRLDTLPRAEAVEGTLAVDAYGTLYLGETPLTGTYHIKDGGRLRVGSEAQLGTATFNYDNGAWVLLDGDILDWNAAFGTSTNLNVVASAGRYDNNLYLGDEVVLTQPWAEDRTMAVHSGTTAWDVLLNDSTGGSIDMVRIAVPSGHTNTFDAGIDIDLTNHTSGSRAKLIVGYDAGTEPWTPETGANTNYDQAATGGHLYLLGGEYDGNIATYTLGDLEVKTGLVTVGENDYNGTRPITLDIDPTAEIMVRAAGNLQFQTNDPNDYTAELSAGTLGAVHKVENGGRLEWNLKNTTGAPITLDQSVRFLGGPENLDQRETFVVDHHEFQGGWYQPADEGYHLTDVTLDDTAYVFLRRYTMDRDALRMTLKLGGDTTITKDDFAAVGVGGGPAIQAETPGTPVTLHLGDTDIGNWEGDITMLLRGEITEDVTLDIQRGWIDVWENPVHGTLQADKDGNIHFFYGRDYAEGSGVYTHAWGDDIDVILGGKQQLLIDSEQVPQLENPNRYTNQFNGTVTVVNNEDGVDAELRGQRVFIGGGPYGDNDHARVALDDVRLEDGADLEYTENWTITVLNNVYLKGATGQISNYRGWGGYGVDAHPIESGLTVYDIQRDPANTDPAEVTLHSDNGMRAAGQLVDVDARKTGGGPLWLVQPFSGNGNTMYLDEGTLHIAKGMEAGSAPLSDLTIEAAEGTEIGGWAYRGDPIGHVNQITAPINWSGTSGTMRAWDIGSGSDGFPYFDEVRLPDVAGEDDFNLTFNREGGAGALDLHLTGNATLTNNIAGGWSVYLVNTVDEGTDSILKIQGGGAEWRLAGTLGTDVVVNGESDVLRGVKMIDHGYHNVMLERNQEVPAFFDFDLGGHTLDLVVNDGSNDLYADPGAGTIMAYRGSVGQQDLELGYGKLQPETGDPETAWGSGTTIEIGNEHTARILVQDEEADFGELYTNRFQGTVKIVNADTWQPYGEAADTVSAVGSVDGYLYNNVDVAGGAVAQFDNVHLTDGSTGHLRNMPSDGLDLNVAGVTIDDGATATLVNDDSNMRIYVRDVTNPAGGGGSGGTVNIRGNHDTRLAGQIGAGVTVDVSDTWAWLEGNFSVASGGALNVGTDGVAVVNDAIAGDGITVGNGGVLAINDAGFNPAGAAGTLSIQDGGAVALGVDVPWTDDTYATGAMQMTGVIVAMEGHSQTLTINSNATGLGAEMTDRASITQPIAGTAAQINLAGGYTMLTLDGTNILTGARAVSIDRDVRINGAQNYAGGTTIGSGRVVAMDADALGGGGGGAVSLAGGDLEIHSAGLNVSSLGLDGGGIYANTSATVAGALTESADTTFGAGTGGTLTFNSGVQLTGARTWTVDSGAVEFLGDVTADGSGPYDMVKAGTGTLKMTGGASGVNKLTVGTSPGGLAIVGDPAKVPADVEIKAGSGYGVVADHAYGEVDKTNSVGVMALAYDQASGDHTQNLDLSTGNPELAVGAAEGASVHYTGALTPAVDGGTSRYLLGGGGGTLTVSAGSISDQGDNTNLNIGRSYQATAAPGDQGLYAGRLGGSFNTGDANPGDVRLSDLRDMNWSGNSGDSPTTFSESGDAIPYGRLWADNTTWVYTGYFLQDAPGKVSFAENFDDSVRVVVDGQMLIENGAGWNTPTQGTAFLDAGWHEFEVRFGQGGGGVGPVGGWTFGLGYDLLGRGTTNAGDYAAIPAGRFAGDLAAPEDPGVNNQGVVILEGDSTQPGVAGDINIYMDAAITDPDGDAGVNGDAYEAIANAANVYIRSGGTLDLGNATLPAYAGTNIRMAGGGISRNGGILTAVDLSSVYDFGTKPTVMTVGGPDINGGLTQVEEGGPWCEIFIKVGPNTVELLPYDPGNAYDNEIGMLVVKQGRLIADDQAALGAATDLQVSGTGTMQLDEGNGAAGMAIALADTGTLDLNGVTYYASALSMAGSDTDRVRLAGGGTLYVGDAGDVGATGTGMEIAENSTLYAGTGGSGRAYRVLEGSTLNLTALGGTMGGIDLLPESQLGITDGDITLDGGEGLTLTVDPAGTPTDGTSRFYNIDVAAGASATANGLGTPDYETDSGLPEQPVAHVKKTGDGTLTVNDGFGGDATKAEWLVEAGTLAGNKDGLGATAHTWIQNDKSENIVGHHLEGIEVMGGATLQWAGIQGSLPATEYPLALPEGDGLLATELVMHSGSTLVGDGLVLGYGFTHLGADGTVAAEQYPLYPTVVAPATGDTVLNIGGTTQLNSGLAVSGGDGKVTVNVTSGDVEFNSYLPGQGQGFDAMDQLHVQGGRARLYHDAHASITDSSVGALATLDFNAGEGNAVTLPGDMQDMNGTVSVTSGTATVTDKIEASATGVAHGLNLGPLTLEFFDALDGVTGPGNLLAAGGGGNFDPYAPGGANYGDGSNYWYKDGYRLDYPGNGNSTGGSPWVEPDGSTTQAYQGSDATPVLKDIAMADADQIGFRATGVITVPADGTYTFRTRSDDGSMLWIDPADGSGWQTVVANDYWQGFTGRSGSIYLPAGSYPVAFGWYEGGGGAGFDVHWQNSLGQWVELADPVVLPAISVAEGATLNAAGGFGNIADVSIGGTLNVGADSDAQGPIHGTTDTAVLAIPDGVTLDAYGGVQDIPDVNLGGVLNTYADSNVRNINDESGNYGDLAIDTDVRMQVTGNGTVDTIDNAGQLHLVESTSDDPHNFLVNNAATQLAATTLSGGSWRVDDNNTLQMPGTPSIVTNQAAVALNGTNANMPGISDLASNEGSLSVTSGKALATAAGLDNTATGQLNIDAATMTINGNLNNAGQVDVGGLRGASIGDDTNATFPDGGSAVRVSADQIDITASGHDIWGTSDGCYLLYREVDADEAVDLTTRVMQFAGGNNGWRKAGIMVRDSLDPASKNAAVIQAENNNLRGQTRPSDGGGSGSGGPGGNVEPTYLRITKEAGSWEFNYYYRDDVNDPWTQITGPRTTDPMSGTMYVGLVATSHNASQQTTASFDTMSNFFSPGALTITGSLINSGALSSLGEADVEVQDAMDNSGDLTVGAGSSLAVANNGVNTGTLTAEGGGDITIGAELDNTGTVQALAGVNADHSDITADTIAQYDDISQTLQAGTWVIEDYASISATGTPLDIIANDADVTLRGPNSVFGINNLADNAGSFTISNRDFTTAGNLTNTGTVAVDNGTFAVTGTLAELPGNTLTDGAWVVGENGNVDLQLSGSILTIGPSAEVRLAGPNWAFGKLNNLQDNQGTFAVEGGAEFDSAGDLANSGALSVGAGSRVTVNGGFTGTGTAAVDGVLELNPEAAASTYDGPISVGEEGSLQGASGVVTLNGLITGSGTTPPEGVATLPGIAAHWKLDETGGSTAVDSADGADGTIGGNPQLGQPGIVNLAYRFDGDQDQVNCGQNTFGSPGEGTISLWFNRQTDRTGDSTNHDVNNVLIANSSGSSNDNFELGTEGGDIEIYLDTGGGSEDTTVRTGAGIVNDTWYHIALTYDQGRNNEAQVYLDGALVDQWTQFNGTLDAADGTPLSLGLARPSSDQWGDFDGLLDDVQLYTRALDPSEIATLIAGANPTISLVVEATCEMHADGGFTDMPWVKVLGTLAVGADSDTYRLDNLGTIQVEPGVTLTATDEVVQYAGDPDYALTGGAWEIAGTLTMPAGTTIQDNQADVTINGPGAVFNELLNNLQTNSGSLAVTGGYAYSTPGDLANSGTLSVGAGSQVTVTGMYTGTGNTVSDGELVLEGAGSTVANPITGTGLLAVSSGADLTGSLNGLDTGVFVEGLLTVDANSTATGTVQGAGELAINSGVELVADGGLSALDAGIGVEGTLSANANSATTGAISGGGVLNVGTGVTFDADGGLSGLAEVNLASGATLNANANSQAGIVQGSSGTLATAAGVTMDIDDRVAYLAQVNIGDGSALTTGTTIASEPSNVVEGLAIAEDGSGNPLGSWDVRKGNLIVDYTGTPSPMEDLEDYVASGYAGGNWDGLGINSSAANDEKVNGQGLTGLGIIDNDDPNAGVGGKTDLEGETVDADSVLIKYTYYGDANLDGTVNIDDLNLLEQTWALGPQPGGSEYRWGVGDFDYDEDVDIDDLNLLERSYALQGGPLTGGEAPAPVGSSAPAPTPEPATLALLGLGAAAMLARRRRSR